MRHLERRKNFFKIVILDGYTINPGDLSWEPFKELGEVIYYDRTSSKDVIAHIKDANIVLTNEVPINARTLEMCQNIVYIGVLSTGYNHIDIETAHEKGIVVSNIPALDVASIEPIPDDSKLLSHPNVILTPHITGAAKEVREKTMYWAVENLRRYLQYEELNRV